MFDDLIASRNFWIRVSIVDNEGTLTTMLHARCRAVGSTQITSRTNDGGYRMNSSITGRYVQSYLRERGIQKGKRRWHTWWHSTKFSMPRVLMLPPEAFPVRPSKPYENAVYFRSSGTARSQIPRPAREASRARACSWLHSRVCR